MGNKEKELVAHALGVVVHFGVFVDAGMMLTMIRALGTAVESFFEPHGHHEK